MGKDALNITKGKEHPEEFNPEYKETQGKGWDFGHIIEGGTQEDIDYIYNAFLSAVEAKGLTCGGGVKPIRLDALYCRECYKILSDSEEDYEICSQCFNKMAKELGYRKPLDRPPLLSIDEESIKSIWLWWQDAKNVTYGDLIEKVMKVQWDSDIKWYEGK